MTKIDISWDPVGNNDFYITYPNELALYSLKGSAEEREVCTEKTIDSVYIPVCDYFLAYLLSRNDEISFLKCYQPHPNVEFRHLVALGQANGRVSISAAAPQSVEHQWMYKEFVPKHTRSCLSLTWNPNISSYLAIGLDKYRSDSSLLVWDLNSKSDLPSFTSNNFSATDSLFSAVASNTLPPADSRKTFQFDMRESVISTGSSAIGQLGVASSQSKVAFETGSSEAVMSVTWMRQSPRSLLAGMSNRFVRLFDLRDFTKAQTTIQTKACHGLTLDPYGDERLCSYYENQVYVWDLRYPEKPLLKIVENKMVSKLQWDPVKRNVFASLCKDSPSIHVYHLQQIATSDDVEISYVEHTAQPKCDKISGSQPPMSLASFSLHPSEENRVLFVYTNGRPAYVSVCRELPIAWSHCFSDSIDELLTAFPRTLVECGKIISEDISSIVKRRVTLGYGIASEKSGAGADRTIFQRAADICAQENDEKLQLIWLWMHKLNVLPQEDPETWSPGFNKYAGALEILLQQSSAGRLNSNTEFRSMLGPEFTGHTLMVKVFVSSERDRLLQLHGWGGMGKERNYANDSFINRLLLDKQYERAAAIALFTLRLKQAAQILISAANEASASAQTNLKHLQIVALALAGFPGLSDKDFQTGSNLPQNCAPPLWLELCQSALANLENPYLKSAFQFLACRCSGSTSYDTVLECENLPLHDKIAFAAIHLSDVDLEKFLHTCYNKCLKMADLSGLLICGLGNEDSLQLVEKYVDETSDVQTAALLFLLGGCHSRYHTQIPPSPTSTAGSDPPVIPIMNGDMTLTSGHYDVCRCDQIIDAYCSLLDRWRLWHARAETESLKGPTLDKQTPQIHLTCIFCSKPVCSTAGKTRQRLAKPSNCPTCRKPLPRCALCRIHLGLSTGDTSRKLNKFDSWFCWCQNCRHGGHANHILDWFKLNTECPVTGCSCKCWSLDADF